MIIIDLRKITAENYRECLELEVTDEQRGFVAPNAVSLAESGIFRYESLPFAVYADEKMIGFVMLFYHPKKSEYGIWRLMIDKNFQGKGYGKLALQLCVEYLAQEFLTEEILLSVEPENEVAMQLYTSFGFEETGEIEDGEVVMRLTLEKPVQDPYY